MVDSYSIDEAAAVLGVRKRRIWELVARGVLAGVPEEGGGMRIFLQGKPVVPSTSQPDGHRETNGNGGGHQQPSFDATPFRELLTEFRNLTERYGQALLALGEARGEVAALRTRVELLEARVDLRLPVAAPPFSWAQQPAVAEPNLERELAQEPEEVASGPEAAPPESEVAAPALEAIAPEAEAPRAPRQERPAVASQTELPRRGEGRGRRKGDARSAVAALGEALARAEDPSLSHLPGAEEAASAFAELQSEVAAEQENTLHEPETTRFSDEPELTRPVADESPTIEATEFEPPTDELDHVTVAESVAASELLPDAILADDAPGQGSDGLADASKEEADLSAERDLDEAEPEAVTEVASDQMPEVTADERESDATPEQPEPASSVSADESETIGSSGQTPWPAAPVSYSSEWDEPDWIAEEDIEEPTAKPMSSAGVAPLLGVESAETVHADASFTEVVDQEAPANTGFPSWTEEAVADTPAIELPTEGLTIEPQGDLEPEAQPIEFEAIEPQGDLEPEAQPIEFEAIEPEPVETAADDGWERAIDDNRPEPDDATEPGASPIGSEPEPFPPPEAPRAADLDFTAEPEAMSEQDGLPDAGPAVESATESEAVEIGALPDLQQPHTAEPEPIFGEEIRVEPSSEKETGVRLAPFLLGGVPEEEPAAELLPEPLPLPEEPAQRSPWAELDTEMPTPDVLSFEPSGDSAGDAGLDTSAGEIAAASVERGVEEEVMWLGGGQDEVPPSPVSFGPQAIARRAPTPPRRVSPAEEQALSRLARERGWDDDELTAIRSLLAQPAPRSVVEATGAPTIDVRQGLGEPQPASPEVRPTEATVAPAVASAPAMASEPAMAPEAEPEPADPQPDDEAFDWEQGPAAWSPPHVITPSADLPGGIELDEAMAQLQPFGSPVRPPVPDEPEAEPEAQVEPASSEEQEAPPAATEPSVSAKAAPEVPEPPAQVTSSSPVDAPPESEGPEPAAGHSPSPPFVRPDDPDWLRGRRGPAATAYRRLRRLFPG